MGWWWWPETADFLAAEAVVGTDCPPLGTRTFLETYTRVVSAHAAHTSAVTSDLNDVLAFRDFAEPLELSPSPDARSRWVRREPEDEAAPPPFVGRLISNKPQVSSVGIPPQQPRVPSGVSQGGVDLSALSAGLSM